ncbi:MAG: tetratricopeptide repeat protein [Myxococcales bacterium]|nr:tetratricopeptide repeat protein [Myxococcales bacterium]
MVGWLWIVLAHGGPAQVAEPSEAALAALRQAVDEDPADPEAHYELGAAQQEQGDHQAARASFERVLQLRDGHLGALYNLALLQGEAGEWDQAAATWARVVAVGPEVVEAPFNHGQALQLAARYPEALAAFESVWATNEQDWRALAKIVQLRHAVGDLEGRDSAREELFALREGGTVPDLSAAPSYVREQFRVEDVRVFAVETFELVGPVGKIHIFFLLQADTEEELGTISLGSYDGTTAIARELGQIGPDERQYHLDGYSPDGSAHQTFGMFGAEPSYDDVRAMVADILTPDPPGDPADLPRGQEEEEVPSGEKMRLGAKLSKEAKRRQRRERRAQKREQRQAD